MPLYEYECLECGLHFDQLQRFAEPEPPPCPNGHCRVHRLLSQPAIIFKGSGFYVTDNRSSSQRKPEKLSQQDEGEKSAVTSEKPK